AFFPAAPADDDDGSAGRIVGRSAVGPTAAGGRAPPPTAPPARSAPGGTGRLVVPRLSRLARRPVPQRGLVARRVHGAREAGLDAEQLRRAGHEPALSNGHAPDD